MAMQPILDYASKPADRLSRLAIVAFILGVFCGHILAVTDDLVFQFVVVAGYRLGVLPELPGMLTLLAVWVSTFIICIVAWIRVDRSNERLRGFNLAMAGLCACVFWGLLNLAH